jgi:hypothetical protein
MVAFPEDHVTEGRREDPPAHHITQFLHDWSEGNTSPMEDKIRSVEEKLR